METKIFLDRERTLKFTLNSLIKFEKITGISITEMEKNADKMEVILALIYVGLIWEDKDITLEEVGDLITLDKMEEITRAITGAMSTVK